MDGESKRDRAAAVMHRINQAWLDGRVEDLALRCILTLPWLYPALPVEYRDEKIFSPGSAISARALKFTNSKSTINK